MMAASGSRRPHRNAPACLRWHAGALISETNQRIGPDSVPACCSFWVSRLRCTVASGGGGPWCAACSLGVRHTLRTVTVSVPPLTLSWKRCGRSWPGCRRHWRNDTCAVEQLATKLAAIPGVVAVTLGGSRASNTAVEGSDWDFGLYYRGSLDPAGIVALGWPGLRSGRVGPHRQRWGLADDRGQQGRSHLPGPR